MGLAPHYPPKGFAISYRSTVRMYRGLSHGHEYMTNGFQVRMSRINIQTENDSVIGTLQMDTSIHCCDAISSFSRKGVGFVVVRSNIRSL